MDRLVGVQVVYIPGHICRSDNLQLLNGQQVNDLLMKHIEVQAGFISSSSGAYPGCVFVRYWLSGKIGIELRTVNHGELTPLCSLVFYKSTDNNDVIKALVADEFDEQTLRSIDDLFTW